MTRYEIEKLLQNTIPDLIANGEILVNLVNNSMFRDVNEVLYDQVVEFTARSLSVDHSISDEVDLDLCQKVLDYVQKHTEITYWVYREAFHTLYCIKPVTVHAMSLKLADTNLSLTVNHSADAIVNAWGVYLTCVADDILVFRHIILPDDVQKQSRKIYVNPELHELTDKVNTNDLIICVTDRDLKQLVNSIDKSNECGQWRICKDCNKLFFLPDSEARWYDSKELSMPKRCHICRNKRYRNKR